MKSILRTLALLIFVVLTAAAQAGLLDYFRKPSGLYVSTNVTGGFSTVVSELDFRADNTFTWKEYERKEYSNDQVINKVAFAVNGTWILPLGAVKLELKGLNAPFFFVLDEGDLIEQQGAKRRFLNKNNAGAR